MANGLPAIVCNPSTLRERDSTVETEEREKTYDAHSRLKVRDFGQCCKKVLTQACIDGNPQLTYASIIRRACLLLERERTHKQALSPV